MLCWETLFVQLPNHRAANDSVYQKRFSFCPISRWSSTCWWIFRCSSALVWGGCTYTGHFWSPGLPEKFIWFLSMTSNFTGCTLLNGCFVEWTYAQFTKCCSPKKMASSILTEASLPAQISGLWHQVVMLYMHPCLGGTISLFLIYRSCFLRRTGRAFLALLATCIISTLLSTHINIFSTLFIAWVIQCRASQVKSVVENDEIQFGELSDDQDIHLV